MLLTPPNTSGSWVFVQHQLPFSFLTHTLKGQAQPTAHKCGHMQLSPFQNLISKAVKVLQIVWLLSQVCPGVVKALALKPGQNVMK